MHAAHALPHAATHAPPNLDVESDSISFERIFSSLSMKISRRTLQCMRRVHAPHALQHAPHATRMRRPFFERRNCQTSFVAHAQ
jgi:hypothetical protein